MGTNKLQRFEEIGTFENVFELTDFQDEDVDKPKGRWQEDIFGNSNPIFLELACGKGAYALELARRNPQKNFVGIDIKGARIWKGAKRALAEELENLRFLRIYIDHLDEYFGPDEVDDIWITFPDPYPNFGDRSKRLTSPKFLDIYSRVLKSEGKVRLKTDSDELFEFTRNVVENQDCSIDEIIENIYAECPEDEILTIKTFYEKRHLEAGKTIKFISFSLPDQILV
ncbi:MAG TPA: tRNA (guanosine(46)-N7)-methyltransferase TrmB [Balneolaceae bacterium]|nr:tRNA (guanosine(46)-N7)-methyltransferase TrmB [Balneolaceae bacterium]